MSDCGHYHGDPWVKKYGDAENVERDKKTLKEILLRQGSNLVLDTVAEFVGEVAEKFKSSDDERHTLRTGLIQDLTNALCDEV